MDTAVNRSDPFYLPAITCLQVHSWWGSWVRPDIVHVEQRNALHVNSRPSSAAEQLENSNKFRKKFVFGPPRMKLTNDKLPSCIISRTFSVVLLRSNSVCVLVFTLSFTVYTEWHMAALDIAGHKITTANSDISTWQESISSTVS